MTDRPTHRHKKTGDIVFWGAHLDPRKYEPLPDEHWDGEEIVAARIAGEVINIKAEAERRILAKWPIHKQLNALHETDAAWVATMRADIRAIRDWSNDEKAKLRGL